MGFTLYGIQGRLHRCTKLPRSTQVPHYISRMLPGIARVTSQTAGRYYWSVYLQITKQGIQHIATLRKVPREI